MQLAAHPRPHTVCVDLDGTLIAGDLLWESFITLVKARPFVALAVLLSVFKGRAHFKKRVAQQVRIDPAGLLYRPDLLAYLEQLHRDGITLVLATASDEIYAQAVAAHLGIFAEVVASNGHTNLSGSRKADSLVERYAHPGFHYIGNDWSDVSVWRAASESTVVAPSPRLVRYIETHQLVNHVHGTRRGLLRPFVRALRPHQWVKNLLVFVPVVAAHQVLNVDLWVASALTFLAFSLAASAIYVLNDISDIEADRLHPGKRTRPFAAGEVSIPAGCAAAAVLLAASMTVAVVGVSWGVACVVMAYVAATSAYSLVLKREPVADVFTLTGLYVLRIVAGGLATGTTLSSWLLAFALFFFLSLAFVKRYAELVTIKGRMPGRGYGPDDALWMHAIGTTAGYLAVLVLALYVNASDVARLYTRPQVLWFLCPLLLFWITRLWFRAGRRLVHDDPVIDAFKDRVSYAMLVVMSLVIFAAI